jgi:hypothetical protein
MTKQLYKFLLLAAGIGMLSSCNKEKYLNPAPTTSLQAADAFSTPARILSQVNGMYNALRAGNFMGGRYYVYNDIRGEEFINMLTNGVTGLQTWNHTLNSNSNEVVNLWSAAYFSINSDNLFLDGMALKGNAVVGTALAANYNGEARFLRGLAYFELLQLYARPYWDGNGSKPGVPLRLTGNSGLGPNDLARTSVDSIYKQIIADLDFAEANLPLTNASATLNVTRAHRNTAIALKTRVYLAMGQYDKVITEANKIVSATAPFTAATGVANALQADPTTPFKTFTTTESVFSMPFTTSTGDVPGTQNQMGYYYSPSKINGNNAGNGEYSLNAAGIIADAGWLAADKRKAFVYTHTDGKKYLIKWPSPSPYPDWVPVIRYSEVLLNLAEARTRVTNTVDPQAVAMLNAIRNRADASTIYTVASFATPTDLINAILKERRIELLGEGFRSFDLLRLGQIIPGKGTAPTINPTQSEYIWPISFQELLNNKLCVQNP